MEKQPTLYLKKEECCGCTACYSVCPTHSISMIEDKEGFLYPIIQNETCIACFLCEKVCPMKRASHCEINDYNVEIRKPYNIS